MSKKNILIAASGTGGHLFPGKYIAESIKELAPESNVYFVGSGRPLEEKIIDTAGFKRFVIQTSGLKRLGIKGLIKWLFSLPNSVSQCRKIFQEVKPNLVIGVGGYASFLPVLYAWFTGVSTWIHEAERTSGLANYVLSFFAKNVSVSFEKTRLAPIAKPIYTGHPLRPTLKRENFIKSSNKEVENILVMGGSQGSSNIDFLIKDSLAEILELKRFNFFHQARAENIEILKESYKSYAVNATVVCFIENIEKQYQWADLIISRTGAGAVREIYITEKPTICIPLPNAKEQLENAQVLVECGLGCLLEEQEDKIKTRQQLVSYLKDIVENYTSYKLKHIINELSADEFASKKIARHCIDTLNKL